MAPELLKNCLDIGQSLPSGRRSDGVFMQSTGFDWCRFLGKIWKINKKPADWSTVAAVNARPSARFLIIGWARTMKFWTNRKAFLSQKIKWTNRKAPSPAPWSYGHMQRSLTTVTTYGHRSLACAFACRNYCTQKKYYQEPLARAQLTAALYFGSILSRQRPHSVGSTQKYANTANTNNATWRSWKDRRWFWWMTIDLLLNYLVL